MEHFKKELENLINQFNIDEKEPCADDVPVELTLGTLKRWYAELINVELTHLKPKEKTMSKMVIIHICEVCQAEIRRTEIKSKESGSETIHDGLCKECAKAQKISIERGHDR